ncbi:uncharacterized protein KQ657_000340 [Scheffersomyces spartinae]|uniref:DNA-directed RNA polymerase n=1 Tax=Scheffersomyces spartinae TaxID=45513 RepID=A0A9P7V9S3_9ASCO|nr:uncharacterized protein KQ657_000340 [Scheffersomyces spartinae]KAG7193655.1 hypothetical protein KQ657_000340 [Scheffersomyces spartinae]
MKIRLRNISISKSIAIVPPTRNLTQIRLRSSYTKSLTRPQWKHIHEFTDKLQRKELAQARSLLTKSFKSYELLHPRIIQIMLMQLLDYQLQHGVQDAYALVLLYEEFGAYKPVNTIDLELEIVQRDIELKFFVCFLQLFVDLEDTMTPMSQKILHHKIQSLATTYQFQQHELDRILTTHDRRRIYNLVVGSYTTFDTSTDLLHSGSLVPLDSLCEFIAANRYSEYDSHTQKKAPMYELYDLLLSEDEQRVFMQKYMRFNSIKQSVIERSSQILKPTKEIGDSEQIQMNHQFDQWIKQIIEGMEDLLVQLKNVPLSATKDEIPSHLLHVFQYRLVIESLPKKITAEIILSHLLSKCATESKYQAATVVSICKSLAPCFDWIGTTTSLGLTLSFEERVSIIGSLLDIPIRRCTFLKKSSKVPTPVFQYWLAKTLPSEKLKTIGAIKIDPYLMPTIRKTVWSSKAMNITLPMLSTPVPWSSPNKGGNLFQRKSFLLLSQEASEPHPLIFKADENHDLDSTYNVLTNLGSVAWAINPRMIQTFSEALKYPNGFMNITPTLECIPHVVLPEPNEADYESKDAFYRARKMIHGKNADAHKEYIALYTIREQLETTAKIAQAYASNGDMIYFPHGVDFRGRTYPFTTPLNHHSQDVVRSLLMMWNAKPLGPNGLQWLKYHLGGMYGSVLPFEDRIAYIDSHMDDIIDSAQHPFDCKGWWKNGLKPFQTLSLCFELASITKFVNEGNKVEEYPCRIMIHLDGSCNGLQHYSALGRDIEGGKAVNLIHGNNDDIRGDIYETVRSTVANKFQTKLNDTTVDSEEKRLSKLALSILSRKMVKQTVMTSVYGVTPFGARLQVKKRISELLEELEIKKREGVPIEVDVESINKLKFELAFQIANATLDSIDELFSNAKRIEDWLKENCFRVLTSFHKPQISFVNAKFYQPFMWYTYSRFLVIQDYTAKSTINVPSALQLITLSNRTSSSSINLRKHLNSIPPNFVHSLDSSHLALTCLAAHDAGVTFAAVHDSFWTYPSQAEQLGTILRQTFVELHSSNILETLVTDLKSYTRASFQLVWICNKENPQLVQAILDLRKAYHVPNVDKTEYFDGVLSHEFNETSKAEVTPKTLVEVYNPKLYHRTTQKSLKEYNESVVAVKSRIEFNVDNFTPVLIPIRLLDPPTKGQLDINDILKSTYFFS